MTREPDISAETSALLSSSGDATSDAVYYEYTKAANPIGSGIISKVPYRSFLPELYAEGPTRAVVLDLSAELQTPWPATGPGLCASFLRINAGDSLALEPNATSQVLYVVRGSGEVSCGEDHFAYQAGAFIALPGVSKATLSATQDTAMYCVDDSPLLNYLGVRSTTARFAPTYYPPERAQEELRKVAADLHASERSRISVLLGDQHFPQTRTVTHTLWAMFGLLPAGAVQKPHRHQSIALDFIVHAPKGCYTLVGPQLGADGQIKNPKRVDWISGMAFVTPPGDWHAHFNESSEEALLIPIQDAGLQTYLRALDIRFQA